MQTKTSSHLCILDYFDMFDKRIFKITHLYYYLDYESILKMLHVSKLYSKDKQIVYSIILSHVNNIYSIHYTPDSYDAFFDHRYNHQLFDSHHRFVIKLQNRLHQNQYFCKKYQKQMAMVDNYLSRSKNLTLLIYKLREDDLVNI